MGGINKNAGSRLAQATGTGKCSVAELRFFAWLDLVILFAGDSEVGNSSRAFVGWGGLAALWCDPDNDVWLRVWGIT